MMRVMEGGYRELSRIQYRLTRIESKQPMRDVPLFARDKHVFGGFQYQRSWTRKCTIDGPRPLRSRAERSPGHQNLYSDDHQGRGYNAQAHRQQRLEQPIYEDIHGIGVFFTDIITLSDVLPRSRPPPLPTLPWPEPIRYQHITPPYSAL
jgi:hypothetical protein